MHLFKIFESHTQNNLQQAKSMAKRPDACCLCNVTFDLYNMVSEAGDQFQQETGYTTPSSLEEGNIQQRN